MDKNEKATHESQEPGDERALKTTGKQRQKGFK